MQTRQDDLAGKLEFDLEVGAPALSANAIAVKYRVSETHARKTLHWMCRQSPPLMQAVGKRPEEWVRI